MLISFIALQAGMAREQAESYVSGELFRARESREAIAVYADLVQGSIIVTIVGRGSAHTGASLERIAVYGYCLSGGNLTLSFFEAEPAERSVVWVGPGDAAVVQLDPASDLIWYGGRSPYSSCSSFRPLHVSAYARSVEGGSSYAGVSFRSGYVVEIGKRDIDSVTVAKELPDGSRVSMTVFYILACGVSPGDPALMGYSPPPARAVHYIRMWSDGTAVSSVSVDATPYARSYPDKPYVECSYSYSDGGSVAVGVEGYVPAELSRGVYAYAFLGLMIFSESFGRYVVGYVDAGPGPGTVISVLPSTGISQGDLGTILALYNINRTAPAMPQHYSNIIVVGKLAYRPIGPGAFSMEFRLPLSLPIALILTGA